MTGGAHGEVLPTFRARRLLYVGTGAIGAAHTPYWLKWLRTGYPGLQLRVVVTRGAERFVTRGALAPVLGDDVLVDAWSEQPTAHAPHVELATWPDAVIVNPASLHFVARMALGIVDTPLMLALACTSAPVVLAPSLPPGGLTSPTYRRHTGVLAEHANVAVVPPEPGLSITTGLQDASVSAPLPDLVTAAEELRRRLPGAP